MCSEYVVCVYVVCGVQCAVCSVRCVVCVCATFTAMSPLRHVYLGQGVSESDGKEEVGVGRASLDPEVPEHWAQH